MTDFTHINRMISRRLMSLVFLYLFMVLSQNSCIFPEKIETKDSLIVGIESYPNSLDPRYATDAAGSKLSELLFNGLVKKEADGSITGDLAESFEIKDGIHYIFQLREDIVFHNGEQCTADNIKAAIESVLAKGSASPRKKDFNCIKSIEVPDKKTVIITLSEVFVPFLSTLTMGIPSESMLSSPEPSADRIVGTGPFCLEHIVPGRELILVRNEHYFQKKAHIKKVQFKVIKDGIIRVMELLKGTIELTQNDISPRFIRMLRNKDTLSLQQSPSSNFTYMGFNMKDAILKNKTVRKAIAYSIDRDSIIEEVFLGYAQKSSGLLYPGHWAYTSDVPQYEYNPELAEELLDNAGFPRRGTNFPHYRFQLEYKTSQNPFRQMVATIIQRQLAQVGIDIRIISLEWPTFYDHIKKGNFQLFTLMWVGIDEPDIYFNLFHSSMIPPTGANRGRYQKDLIDRLTEEARCETDLEERISLYARIQRIIAQDLPYVSLWHEYNVAIMRKNVKGYILHHDASYRSLTDVIEEENSR